MPTVSVFEDSLKDALGDWVTEKTFDELCFEFGLELDEVTNDYEMVKKERGEEAAKGLSQRTIYKVDVPANRYDLLCIEGLVMALKIFQDKMPIPKYVMKPLKPQPKMKMTVTKATAQIRPYVVCAVLRGLKLTPDSYQSLIDLQDKLHQNICRRRQLVAIGTHDLDKIEGPFTYEALPPKDIHFVPLKETRKMDGNQLMEHLSTHLQLKQYLPIIRDSPVYPVIYDKNRTVLSLPPIINGDPSKITLETKNMFIEMTATDLTKANICLNTICAMFGEELDEPFTVEPVEVVYASDYPPNSFTKPNDKIIYPQMEPLDMDANISRMKADLALDDLTSAQVSEYMRRMCIENQVDPADPNVLHCKIPITRSDVMHERDLVEDLAIAYGYNKLPQVLPQTLHWPKEQLINHLTDLLRPDVAMAGFYECLNFTLISEKENFSGLRREQKTEELWRTPARPHEYNPSASAIWLSNPKTKEFEVVRTTLLAGLLKTLNSNKHLSPPVKVFEIGDVVIQDPTRETGSKNQRRVCALHAGLTSGFEVIHGLLDQLMWKLNVEPAYARKVQKKKEFKLVPSKDPAFFEGRQANIVIEGIIVGVLGVLHPDCLKAFDVTLPTSALEFNLEPFMDWI